MWMVQIALTLFEIRNIIRLVDFERTKDQFTQEEWGYLVTLQAGFMTMFSILQVFCFDFSKLINKLPSMVSLPWLTSFM